MTRWVGLFLGLGAVLVACTCIAPPEGTGRTTRSRQEFALRYPDLDISYYNNVVEIESLAAQGQSLYDAYFDGKLENNRIDINTRERALAKFRRAQSIYATIWERERSMRLSAFYSSEIRPYMEKLLKEIEQPDRSAQPGPGR